MVVEALEPMGGRDCRAQEKRNRRVFSSLGLILLGIDKSDGAEEQRVEGGHAGKGGGGQHKPPQQTVGEERRRKATHGSVWTQRMIGGGSIGFRSAPGQYRHGL